MFFIVRTFFAFLFLFAVHPSLHGTTTKTIYLYAPWWGNIFADNKSDFDTKNRLEPIKGFCEAAKSSGYDIIQVHALNNLQDFEYLIVFETSVKQLKFLEQYPKEKLFLFLWEPPTTFPSNYLTENHRCFSKVFTWCDDLVDNRKYFKFYYPYKLPIIENLVDFDSKKLCTLISSNLCYSHQDELYSERRGVIDFFESFTHDDFRFYGKKWPKSFKNYLGTVYKKSDVLQTYRFSYCYENTKNISGYISEKIFDCFHAGCVPIYWGASNVTQYIPQNCFINRTNFQSNIELYDYLKSMKEEEYQEYIFNIQEFLKSEESDLFSREYFIKLLLDAIQKT